MIKSKSLHTKRTDDEYFLGGFVNPSPRRPLSWLLRTEDVIRQMRWEKAFKAGQVHV